MGNAEDFEKWMREEDKKDYKFETIKEENTKENNEELCQLNLFEKNI